MPCQPGLFQDKPVHADLMCYYCPFNTTTVKTGATSNSSCVSELSYAIFLNIFLYIYLSRMATKKETISFATLSFVLVHSSGKLSISI